jgi:hypothetical protein
MGEISMSGSTREREAAVIGLWAFHSVLSSLLYRLQITCVDLRADLGRKKPENMAVPRRRLHIEWV